MEFPLLFTMQPGASRVEGPGIRLVFPNTAGWLPGQRIGFWRPDPIRSEGGTSTGRERSRWMDARCCPIPALCSTGPYGIRSAGAEAIVALDFIHTPVP